MASIISKLKTMVNIIRKIFIGTNGTLAPHTPEFPAELERYHDEILSDLDRKSVHDDKKNLKGDNEAIRSDAKKAYANYNSFCVNG